MIIIKKLCKSYGSLKVLKDLNLEMRDGEILVILGRSGVGKSVLLRQIIGIEQPDAGSVLIDGQDINSLSREDKRKITQQMGMLFQSGALFDSLNVGENVAFYLRQHEGHLPEEEITKRIKEALEMVDMAGTEKKMPSDLSGGMRKRAALARVIIYRPRIVLFDEPTTGLDPITAMQINQLILKTQKELNGTIIVVTHDIKSAMEIGDRLAFHNNMRIEHVAPKNQFLKIDDPQVKAFFKNASLTDEYLADIMDRS